MSDQVPASMPTSAVTPLPPQQMTARLTERRAYNEKYIHYYFELEQPHRLAFQAGQYVSLKVTERGDRRSYSICSSPDKTHGFELMADITPNGLGSRFLESLAIGTSINFLAPLGRFVMAPINSGEEAVVFVATGAGITPFRSMIFNQLQTMGDKRPMVLHWGMRHERLMFWQDELLELAESFSNFRYHPVISQPTPAWPLCQGRVTNCLSVHDLLPAAGYYLCGNETMIHEVNQLLLHRGVTQDKIHFEKFY